MNVDIDLLSTSAVVIGDRWNEAQLEHIFGPNLNLQELSFNSIDPNSCNHWIWSPTSKHHKISTLVYHQLNQSLSLSDSWNGWRLLWKLNIAPRAKYFLWTLFHGRLSTSNFLYQMRLGPDNHCILCGHFSEMIDHLFWDCIKTKQVWAHLSLKVNTYIHFPSGFASGSWITDGILSKHLTSVVAATAWLLWKSQCDAIFHGVNINFPTIVCKALIHVQEFSSSNYNLLGYCAQSMVDTSLDDLFALGVALQTILDKQLSIKHVFVNTPATLNGLNDSNTVISWSYTLQISSIRSLLNALGSPSIHCIPIAWMTPAVNLATHGFSFSVLNLLLAGRDLPRWIMKAFVDSGFKFKLYFSFCFIFWLVVYFGALGSNKISPPGFSFSKGCEESSKQNASIDGKNEIYIPKRGDIFVLTDSRPKLVSDLIRNGRSYRIAIVSKGGDDDDEMPPDKYNISLSKSLDNDHFCDIGNSKTTFFVVYLLNIAASSRIWKAIDFELATERNLLLVKEVINTKLSIFKERKVPQSYVLGNIKEKMLAFNLNESQNNEDYVEKEFISLEYFVRRKFFENSSSLSQCLATLRTHLPSASVSEESSRDIVFAS
ncbi:uncharacterized protein LOC120276239 [Dioscorea cayenensis subsp. rotundata]|uniref:Uncharacterized protein LOC120276239 n=1 Tax=Dioscorea cayennensis subsp. rotundata TaxID=55577 RepID=A0AB40CFY8_DIOCR|nr:uncharacterized protein LOC120276239 [Dioscorea cayenensis subsp. rotundata]